MNHACFDPNLEVDSNHIDKICKYGVLVISDSNHINKRFKYVMTKFHY